MQKMSLEERFKTGLYSFYTEALLTRNGNNGTFVLKEQTHRIN